MIGFAYRSIYNCHLDRTDPSLYSVWVIVNPRRFKIYGLSGVVIFSAYESTDPIQRMSVMPVSNAVFSAHISNHFR